MKALSVALAVMLMLSASSGARAQAQAAAVSVSILPGPLVAVLEREGSLVVLTVDDLTGSGAGWWATVGCACPVVPVGGPVAAVGQALDRDGGPRLVGATLVAARGHGMGRYRAAFQFTPGVWTVTFADGARP